MLSCDECKKYLQAFLDRALEIRESLDVQDHLRTCQACAHTAETERTLRLFVRQHALTPSVPEHVKRQIIQHAMYTSQGMVWWSHWLAKIRPPHWKTSMATAAATLVATFAALALWSGEDDLAQKLVNEASMAYRAYASRTMPMEVEGPDDSTVTQWFYNHIGYRLPMPGIVDQKIQLLGGRLCRVLDRTGTVMMYQRQGANVLLFAFKDDKLSLPTKHLTQTHAGSFYVQNVSGRPVAIWQRGGITYSLVGDLDRDALLQIASTVGYR